jgi:two-component system, NtrC family, sensor kinase
LESDAFFIGQPARDSTVDNNLYFSRRLNATDGAFDGVVVVAVDAAYFVSGYETAKLGKQGVLGIVGIDGIVRVRRSGESEFSGDVIDYASVVPRSDAADTDPAISTSSWDGVRRWNSARKLFGFPVAVFVGLSADEQLAIADRETLSYLRRASFGSILVIVLSSVGPIELATRAEPAS